MTIRELNKKNKDEYFKLVDNKGNIGKCVYFINGYVRELKKYSISPFDDINKERFVKPTQQVFTEFEF